MDMFTLQADAVALQAFHGLSEEILACRGHAGDIVLFPFDRCVDIVKNLLDGVGDFSANAISGDERDLKRDKRPVAGSVGCLQCRHRHISLGTRSCKVIRRALDV